MTAPCPAHSDGRHRLVTDPAVRPPVTSRVACDCGFSMAYAHPDQTLVDATPHPGLASPPRLPEGEQ